MTLWCVAVCRRQSDRDVLEGGEGVGWDPPPPTVPLWSPPPRVPLWSLPKAGRTFVSLNRFGTEGTKAKFGCQPQTSAGEEGGGGKGGSRGGGAPPPPPTAYGRSNTSLGPGTQQHVYQQWPKSMVVSW